LRVMTTGLEKAESLLLSLEEILASPKFDSSKFLLPEYKFYTNLFFQLLEFHHRWGISWRENLLALKDALSVDLSYERKIQKGKRLSLLQMLLMAFFTWMIFAWAYFQFAGELKLSTARLFLLWQLLGAIVLLLGIHFARIKIFEEFEALLTSFVKVRIYLRVGMPLGEAWHAGAIDSLKAHLKERRAKLILRQLTTLLESIRQGGGRGEEQCNEIARQLVDYQAERFSFFERVLAFLSFFVMALFFMGSYLGLMISFLQNLFH